MPEIKKILFTTDLSENAHYAFNYAADIAAHYNAGIVILNVTEDVPFNVESAIVDMLGVAKFKELQEQHENEAVSKITEGDEIEVDAAAGKLAAQLAQGPSLAFGKVKALLLSSSSESAGRRLCSVRTT